MQDFVKKHFIDQDIEVDSQFIGDQQLYYAAGAPDIALVKDYYSKKPVYEDLIYFSIGETWSQIAPGLKRLFENGPFPADGHGYQLYPYGLPSLQKTLKSYIERSHGIPKKIVDKQLIETAVAGQGTRTAMFDFGRMIKQKASKIPTVISTIPGWDYRGVFEPIGFKNATVSLSPANDFRPDLAAYDRLAKEVDESGDFELAIVTINAQHNPTGRNWSREEILHLIQLACRYKAAIILDDAYFAIHNDHVTPTSALGILVEEFYGKGQSTSPVPWVAVRSLGKQFNSNGWSIGAITGETSTIRCMLNQMLFSRSYPYGSLLQHVMQKWLASDESDQFLKEQCTGYTRKRQLIAQSFIEKLGFSESSINLGECTSYALFEVPKNYHQFASPADVFRKDCFAKTGVLFGMASLNVNGQQQESDRFCRIYMGPSLEQHEEAMLRLEKEGIRYDMKA